MKTVPQITEELISQKPFLEKALADNLINHSALAQTLKPQIEQQLMKKISPSSIIMALKRLSLAKVKSDNLALSHFVQDLIVRSNLYDYTYLNSVTLQTLHQQLLKQITTIPLSFLTISQGTFETTLIFNQQLKKPIDDLYYHEKNVFRSQHLSSITIKLTPQATTHPGTYYQILKTLAWENINVCEVVSTYTELNLLLDDQDVDRAFSLLRQATSSS